MNYYPFHIGDFRSGTVNMTRLARWIYRDMLDVYYDSEKPLPLDLDALCDVIGADTDEERRIVERLLRFKFIKADDGYRHEICEQVISDYRVKAETAKANGKLGGRPRNPNKGKPEPDGNPLGSDSVSTGLAKETQSQTNQEPITKNQKPKKSKTTPAPPMALPDWVPVDAWDAFLAMRKAIRKPVASSAWPLALQKLEHLRAAGNDPRAVLEQSTLNSWQGLFEVKEGHALARASPPGPPSNLGKAGQATARAAEQWLAEQEHG